MSVEIGVVPTLEITEGVWLTLEGVKISSAEFGDVSISDLLGYACQHGRDLCPYFPRDESLLCNALCLRVCPLGEDDGVDELNCCNYSGSRFTGGLHALCLEVWRKC